MGGVYHCKARIAMHFISLWPSGMSGWVWHFTLVYMVGRTVTWQPRVRKDGHQITMHGILRTKFFRCQRWLGILFRSWCTYATTLCFLNRSKVSYRTTGSYTTPVLSNGYLDFYFSGPSDPLPSILVWRDQVISANMNGRIGVYNLQEDTSEVR